MAEIASANLAVAIKDILKVSELFYARPVRVEIGLNKAELAGCLPYSIKKLGNLCLSRNSCDSQIRFDVGAAGAWSALIAAGETGKHSGATTWESILSGRKCEAGAVMPVV